PEQEPVDDREHRRVGADAEREGADHGDGEAGARADAAPGIAKVLPGDLEPGDAPARAAFFLHPLDAPEGEPRLAPGFPGRRARRDQLLRLPLEVEADFLVELAIDVVGPEDRAEPVPQLAPEVAEHRASVSPCRGRGTRRR